MFELKPFIDKYDEDGCRKAFFLEGWLTSSDRNIKQSFQHQEDYIKKLEQRIKQLEDLLEIKAK